MQRKYMLSWLFDICSRKRMKRGGLLWGIGQKQMKSWALRTEAHLVNLGFANNVEQIARENARRLCHLLKEEERFILRSQPAMLFMAVIILTRSAYPTMH